jgi:hypothetical protein
VRQVIKVASLLLSGAAEQTVRFERIILLEQFVSEAAEVWSVPNSRLFALPYSLSRTCRLSLTVRAILAFLFLLLLRILVLFCCLTLDQGQSEDASFEADDAN